MKQSIFNPEQHQNDISSKIVVGLERISEVFKILLWEKAKMVGLSPIQIQILIFIAYHKEEYCKVSHLANEFNVTKPTISDAIKALDAKGLIVKDFSASDSRSYHVQLSPQGAQIVTETEDFAEPLKSQLSECSEADLQNVFEALSKLIFQLNRSGILRVQRTCYACSFHQKKDNSDYCSLLQQTLKRQDIRLDCPEYVAKDQA